MCQYATLCENRLTVGMPSGLKIIVGYALKLIRIHVNDCLMITYAIKKALHQCQLGHRKANCMHVQNDRVVNFYAV